MGSRRSQGIGKIRLTIRIGSLLLILCLFGNSARGEESRPSISISVNQSRVVHLGSRAKTVSVTQPAIADVVVLSPTDLLINGKTIGVTSLIVWNEHGGITNFILSVLPDLSSLQRQLRLLFPEEAIDVTSSGSDIVLRGEISNEVVYDKVLDVAQTYLPPAVESKVAPAPASQAVTVTTSSPRLPQTGTAFAGGGELAFVEENAITDTDRWGDKRRLTGIIDLLVIRESRQIQVDVIVAELSLTKIRELGVDIGLLGKNTSFLSRAGSQGGFQNGDLFTNPSAFPPTTIFGGGASAVLSHVTGNVALTTVYRLFQNKDVAEILAQPRLVMKNGRSGGFLAGGEIPIPFATTDRINIEFKPFGVRLDFVPTITWSDTIDLRIFPEVSEIDPSVAVTFGGVSIPGFKVRRSVNRVEMREGETLILSGLLDRRILRDLSKIPFLGDLPIVGALFRTTRFRNQETELIFVVTPHIVKALRPGIRPPLPSMRKYDDPDFRQIPVPTPPPAAAVSPTPATPLPAPVQQPSLHESPLGETEPMSRSRASESQPQAASRPAARPATPEYQDTQSSPEKPPSPGSSSPPAASHTMP